MYSFRLSGDTYGSPRITLELWAKGWKISVNTVVEIMVDLGFQGLRPPLRHHSLTWQGKDKAASDLAHRHFDAISPNVLRVGDTTEIDTGEEKLYLASVMEHFQRYLSRVRTALAALVSQVGLQRALRKIRQVLRRAMPRSTG